MDAYTKLFELLKDILEQLPSLLALLVCMVVAIARWQKHSKVSLVVLLSLGFLFVHMLVFAVVYNWVPDWFISSAQGADRVNVIRNVYLVLGLITNTSLAVGLALLLVAIFMRRTATSYEGEPLKVGQ